MHVNNELQQPAFTSDEWEWIAWCRIGCFNTYMIFLS